MGTPTDYQGQLPTARPGFAPAPVNSAQWNAQIVQANAQAQQDAINYRAQDPSQAHDWWMTPVEWVGSKLHDVYTQVISRPLATAFIATQIGAAEARDNAQSWSNLFDSNIWDRAYKDSKHVSPGQAFTFGLTHLFDSNDELRKDLQKKVEVPVKDQFGRPAVDAQGKPIKINANETGYLYDNPEAVQKYFDSGANMWISGGMDAATSWFLDPVAKAGKVVGVARDLAYVRPAVTTEQKTFVGVARQATIGKLINANPDADFRFPGAGQDMAKTGQAAMPSTVNVQKNLNSSAFNSMGDLIMKQKGKLEPIEGPVLEGAPSLPTASRFEDWATRQNWAKNSADGGALAAALGRATDRSEVDQVLAVSMGDVGAAQNLSAKNAELGAQLDMIKEQRNNLISSFPAAPNAGQSVIQAEQLQDMAGTMTRIAAQRGEIAAKLDLANSMQSGMYFMPGVSPILSGIGQYARNLQVIKGQGLSAGILAYNNLYVRPMRVFTGATWGDIKAPGHIDINASNSHRAFDAQLSEAKVWSPEERQQLVSKYIAADVNDRGILLDIADRATVGRIAGKYGLTDDQAGSLYRQLGGMKGAAKDGRVYSAANITLPNGSQIRADHIDDAGNIIGVSPILSTQLENTHILTDFSHFDKVMRYNGSAFQKLFREQEIQARNAIGGPLSPTDLADAQKQAIQATAGTIQAKAYKATEVSREIADMMGRLWKFNALLRLGYGPRAIADDFLGQVARQGAAGFFLDRTLMAGRNQMNRRWNDILGDPTGFRQQQASLDSGITVLSQRAEQYQQKIDQINQFLPPVMDYTGKGAKGRSQFNARTTNLQEYQQRLDDTNQTMNDLKLRRNKLGLARDALGDSYILTPDGQAFPRPFEGPQGAMFKDLNTGRRTIDSTFGGTTSYLWNQFRTGDWRVIESSPATETQHLASWLKDVQYQIANDPAAMQVVKGKSVEQLEAWLGSSAGRAYRDQFPLKNMTDEEHADRIFAHVNSYLPSHTPEAIHLRQAVAEGADDKTVASLMSDVKMTDRPSVQSEGLAYGMGKSQVFQYMDNMMSKFYERMNGLPVETLSRNPLFVQLYRQHVNDIWQNHLEQGVTKLTVENQQRITETARKLALKDVKKFTYNMDFESKMAHNLRFISPFFGPMQEAFTRWGRIIADKPEIIARNADLYTLPARSGIETDSNGHTIDSDGYVTNPDGTRTLVPKNEIHMQFQIPTWAQKGLGLDGGTTVDMPINTLSMVLRNDPWFNPGVGPFVQVPANYEALNGNPTFGDALKKFGILQQVQQNPLSQVGGSVPQFVNQLINHDPQQSQKDMLQIMQAEDYKYKNGMRSTEPTWQEVKDKAEHGALMRALMKTVLPVSASFKDPYQFYRDRYSELQRADPKTADQVFLAKYGDSAFAFTGALSKSAKGLPATAEAVMADKRFNYLTDQFPEMAPLIVGPYAQGDFSQTAYAQQVASGERTKLTAKESMDLSKANLGWAQYGKYMNQITSGLYQAGFKSFQDRGAQLYDNQRKGIIAMLTSTTLPNGQVNPYYNDQFDKAFNTRDKSKDDRQAAVMQQIVTEGSLINDPLRKDIQGLAQYMVLRNSVKQMMQRSGSQNLDAAVNANIKQGFHDNVMSLIEGNTMFQSLHDRYLNHDMFNHYDPSLGPETQVNP